MALNHLVRAFWVGCVASIAISSIGCTERHPYIAVGDGGLLDDGGGSTGDGPASDFGLPPVFPDSGPIPDAPPCTMRASCTTATGSYCGVIGDGCGGTMDCGSCPAGLFCGSVSPNICGGAPGCTPITCTTAAGGHYCGKIGDGCGRLLDCGDCTGGEVCGASAANICSKPVPPNCTKLTCAAATGRYCGMVGDGCGGTLDCGDCPNGQVCGSGVANVCGGGPSCMATGCMTATGKYCGTVGDGCGRPLDCGACANGQTCGAGVPNVCGGGPGCTPITCVTANGRYCGKVGDGCGSLLDCGDCTGGQTCAGGGIANVCGGGACTPIACSSANGNYCGVIGNGCGGTVDCGATCPNSGTCGADHVCSGGTPPPPPGCTPIMCTQATGKYCGSVGDGCGRPLDCGGCTAPATCGGGGTANVCGTGVAPGCVPISCSAAGGGRYCGTIGDGCGKTLDCGACAAGQTCGAAGTPNVCAPTSCTAITCQQPTGKYCGSIGDGCGKTLDCGGCTGVDTCAGGGLANVCGHNTCVNLCPRQVTCPASGKTTVTGTVLAPTPPRFGTPDPIYGATVYVPNAAVAPFTAGVSCDRCGAEVSGSPLVQVTTGADGKFTLENVPTGANVPLVIQLGRWRRQVVIPNVTACANTALPADLTRLPRNKAEGDIPLMALSTGKVDMLECVLRKIGIDEAEFTLPTGNGRVQIYQANGAVLAGGNTPNATQLYASAASLAKYDQVLFACQGSPINKPTTAKQRVINYANAGGRVFDTHYSYTWLFDIAPFSMTANWNVDQGHPNDPLTGIIDQSFPKGVAFAQWLQIVGASSAPGQIRINDPRHDLDGVIAPAQRWIYSSNPGTVQHYTFNTPWGTPADQQCGRVLYSDFHVTDTDSSEDVVFPSECANTPLTPQEKVLEFMLFDLASCVQPETQPPAPPPAPPVPPSPPPPPPPAPPPSAPPPTPPPTPPTAPPPPPAAPPPPTSPPPAPPPVPPPPPPPPPPVIP